MLPSEFIAAEIAKLDQSSPAAKALGLGTKLNAIIAALAHDPGRRAIDVLRLANNVASTETITIGSDVYEINIVNTDTTEDTADDELNNTTNPVNVTIAEHGLVAGDLIRVENEIMKVLGVVSEDVVAVRRGHSGTTNAAHADGENIYKAGTPATGSRKEVGLVTTLTPTAAGAAIAAVINSDGTEAVTATVIGNNEVLIAADDVGAVVLACTETLGGANNAWSAAAMYGGRAAGQRNLSIQKRVPTATEVALETMHFMFSFTPTLVIPLVRVTATPGLLKAFDGAVTISGGRVTIAADGATDYAETDDVIVIATD